jgi:hypothetical protein
MRRLLRLLAHWPTRAALRLAALMGIVAAGVMVWAVIDPTPIPVVASMSLSPVFSGVAFVLYGLSIAADLAQAGKGSPGAS